MWRGAGPPQAFRLREPRAAVDQGEWRGATVPFIVRRALVDGERHRIEHHAVVFPRPAHRDEAPGDVLPHSRGIARERIAPPPAATGFQAEEVAALEHDTVPLAGEHALGRCAGVQHHASSATRAAPGDPVRRDERVLHPSGQLRALAHHPHVADDARAAAMKARPARVRPHGVTLHAQRELPLDVLDRVVLLADVIDHVHAVGERARPEAHAETLDAQNRAPVGLVPRAEVVEHVDRRRRRHLTAIALREGAEHAREHAEHGVRAHADGGGKRGLMIVPSRTTHSSRFCSKPSFTSRSGSSI